LTSTPRLFKREAPIQSSRWGAFFVIGSSFESSCVQGGTTSSALHFCQCKRLTASWLVVLIWRCDRRFGKILDALSPLATLRWTIPKYPSKFGEIRNQIRSVGDSLLISACREIQVEHLSAAIDIEIVVHRLSISLGREKSHLQSGPFTVYSRDAVFDNYAVSEPLDFAIGQARRRQVGQRLPKNLWKSAISVA
jgi:hypothetical protein